MLNGTRTIYSFIKDANSIRAFREDIAEWLHDEVGRTTDERITDNLLLLTGEGWKMVAHVDGTWFEVVIVEPKLEAMFKLIWT